MPKPSALNYLLLLLLYGTTSCINTRLVADYSTDNVFAHRKTTVSYIWGLLQPQDIPATCESKTICKVTTQTNLAYILLSAATLGLVVPQKISWDCCPSVVPEEKLNQP